MDLVANTILHHVLVPIIAFIPPILHHIDGRLIAKHDQSLDVVTVADADQADLAIPLQLMQDLPRFKRGGGSS